MNPVGKALWYVESHFAGEISLDEVAAAGGVSRYYLARAFAEATGFPVMQYVRARRLSEAARALAAGAPDILSVALATGYGSHEAFTRAFRDRFGVTPERIRAERNLQPSHSWSRSRWTKPCSRTRAAPVRKRQDSADRGFERAL